MEASAYAVQVAMGYELFKQKSDYNCILLAACAKNK